MLLRDFDSDSLHVVIMFLYRVLVLRLEGVKLPLGLIGLFNYRRLTGKIQQIAGGSKRKEVSPHDLFYTHIYQILALHMMVLETGADVTAPSIHLPKAQTQAPSQPHATRPIAYKSHIPNSPKLDLPLFSHECRGRSECTTRVHSLPCPNLFS